MAKSNKRKIVIKNTDPVFTITGWFLCLLLPLLAYALFTAFILQKSVKINEQIGCISYNELGSSNYSVTYNNEDYKNPSEGWKYISNMIDKIKTSYKYEIHATSEFDYIYSYSVTGKITYYDYIDEEEILNVDEERLLFNDKKYYSGSYLVLEENYDINYKDYFMKAKKYNQTTGVSSSAVLELNFNVNLDISNKDYTDKDSLRRTFTIKVPLSGSTIKITKSNDLNTSGSMCNIRKIRISNSALFITSMCSLGVIFICVILIVVELHKIINKDPYRNEVNRILKNYDRLIVSGKYDIDESNYSNVIYPSKFEELVDASINISEPILFYDVKPNQECHFVIIDDDVLYKYKISRKEMLLEKAGVKK